MKRIIKSMEEKYLLPAPKPVESVFTAHENEKEGKPVPGRRFLCRLRLSGKPMLESSKLSVY